MEKITFETLADGVGLVTISGKNCHDQKPYTHQQVLRTPIYDALVEKTNMGWKMIKQDTLDNLPIGEVILFQSECGRYFSVLTHDTSYDTGKFEWMYIYSREIVDSIDLNNYTKYFVPRAENHMVQAVNKKDETCNEDLDG